MDLASPDLSPAMKPVLAMDCYIKLQIKIIWLTENVLTRASASMRHPWQMSKSAGKAIIY